MPRYHHGCKLINPQSILTCAEDDDRDQEDGAQDQTGHLPIAEGAVLVPSALDHDRGQQTVDPKISHVWARDRKVRAAEIQQMAPKGKCLYEILDVPKDAGLCSELFELSQPCTSGQPRPSACRR